MPLLPATVATQLVSELSERLNDPSAPMDLGELRAALAQLRRAQRSAQPEELGLVFSAIGNVLFRLREFQDALDAHRNAARYDASEAHHLANVAACLAELSRYPQALATLQEARARPKKGPGIEVCILLNTVAVHHRLGDVGAARSAFEEALRHLDFARPMDSFLAAEAAAELGNDDDAVELFARSLAVASRVELGEAPSIEFLHASPDRMKAAAQTPLLAAALARVAARHDAPIPPEHQFVTQIALPPAALTVLDELVEHPPAPTEGLRKLFDEPRA